MNTSTYKQILTHSLTHIFAYPVYSPIQCTQSLTRLLQFIHPSPSPTPHFPHPTPCFPISSTSPVAISPAQSPLLELSLWVWVINQTRTLFTNSTQALPSFHPVSNIIGAWNKRSLQLHQHSDKSECACWQQHS